MWLATAIEQAILQFFQSNISVSCKYMAEQNWNFPSFASNDLIAEGNPSKNWKKISLIGGSHHLSFAFNREKIFRQILSNYYIDMYLTSKFFSMLSVSLKYKRWLIYYPLQNWLKWAVSIEQVFWRLCCRHLPTKCYDCY